MSLTRRCAEESLRRAYLPIAIGVAQAGPCRRSPSGRARCILSARGRFNGAAILERGTIMFNSTIVDVAIGLIFTFLTVSLAVSAILEAIASVMKWRSNTLLQGVKQLLNDPNLTGIALSMYNHALVNPRDSGMAINESQLRNKPAYIVPLQFADALIQIGKITQDSPDKIKAAINAYFTDVQL